MNFCAKNRLIPPLICSQWESDLYKKFKIEEDFQGTLFSVYAQATVQFGSIIQIF
jgi:hypothetical protein